MTTGRLDPSTAFPTFNALAPNQGPMAMPLRLDFTTNNRIEFDLEKAEALNIISWIQSVYADNSDNPVALTIVVDQTGQRIVVPALAQGIWPIIACKSPRFVCTTTAGVNITPLIILLNVPMPLTQWGPIAATASLVTSGAFTDRSGTGTGGSVQIAAANAARKGFSIENLPGNAHSIYLNFGAAATDNSGTPDSYEIMPGGSFGGYLGPVSTQTVNVLATAGEKFIAKEL